MDAKFIWVNPMFDYKFCEANGNSGGVLCMWDPNYFIKEQHILSDSFVALFGTWVSSCTKLLIISIYAPQNRPEKRLLWHNISSLISRFQGDYLNMGDFNEVRKADERMGSIFTPLGLPILMISSPSRISAICIDKHLSDHCPILLRDILVDYGATLFRFYHAWMKFNWFDLMVSQAWNSFDFDDRNNMVRFKKKLQALKKCMREWVSNYKKLQSGQRHDIKTRLSDIDKQLDQGCVNDDILLTRMNLMKQLHDFKASDSLEFLQKAKIQWAVEGDKNSRFFHGIINRKRVNLAIKGIMVDGDRVDSPSQVKNEFCSHFANRFQSPKGNRSRINFLFPNKLSSEQDDLLEIPISNDEIHKAVWACGEIKSPGPNGFTFEFYRKFWNIIGPDFYVAIKRFFDHGSFSKGCNSSFIALIPKVIDPKFVNDYRPISLIGGLYKIVSKVLAIRLSSILDSLISEVQYAFLPKRKILDGPFIINELLSWCKKKKQHTMFFKVDFPKSYDSVRWDFLDDVLHSFGFGSKWRSLILGSLSLGRASILVNGVPSLFLLEGCRCGNV